MSKGLEALENMRYLIVFNEEDEFNEDPTPIKVFLDEICPEDYNAVKTQFSDSAIYHVAGDSISTTVEIAIFGSMTDIDYHKLINNYVETLKGDYEWVLNIKN